jgi:hypothetical protein
MNSPLTTVLTLAQRWGTEPEMHRLICDLRALYMFGQDARTSCSRTGETQCYGSRQIFYLSTILTSKTGDNVMRVRSMVLQDDIPGTCVQ